MLRVSVPLVVALLVSGCRLASQVTGNTVVYGLDEDSWPDPPRVFESKTDQVEVGLGMDPAMKRYPALYDRLQADAIPRLKAFAAESTAERRDDQSTDLAPYRMDISWAIGGETEHLASFEGYEGISAGGAHPDGRVFSTFWDREARREIEAGSLFRPESDSALSALLCRRLVVEKQRRDPSLRDDVSLEDYDCPSDVTDIPFILARATSGSKAAGIVYLLGPYVGGGYAEGAFRIFVPTAALRPLLAGGYADQFSENPRRL